MIKKILGEFLKKLSDVMITEATASLVGSGVEEMPESMKKLR
ncbi:hypothetical protein CLPUN_19810 [Clostridium puniceum]|uniref:Cyclic lactone autoinducer peptide n=1 Tax=Clostridium puniceum TaxID=29367 RepID=A0A1S8TLB6_9CLOT|nr:hypothetical protein [Clostridium puniceum]OOM78372.1 hypothetical protein CLPUN_19810 [Clostridium puniceum]